MESFFFSSRRRHTRWNCDWSSDVCSSDLMAHRLLAFGEVDDGAGLDAARLDLAVADQFHRVGAAAQRLVRRRRLQPRDHAGDLAGADVETSDQTGALVRHLAGLRRLGAIKTGHAASPAFFFFLSLNCSSRAFAASSDSWTIRRSGRRMSTATMSLENSLSSLSSFDSAASALPTSC